MAGIRPYAYQSESPYNKTTEARFVDWLKWICCSLMTLPGAAESSSLTFLLVSLEPVSLELSFLLTFILPGNHTLTSKWQYLPSRYYDDAKQRVHSACGIDETLIFLDYVLRTIFFSSESLHAIGFFRIIYFFIFPLLTDVILIILNSNILL